MNDQSRHEELESRVHSLVDERLFRAFWNGVTYFKTNDLVLFFEENEKVDPVSIFAREKLVNADNVPPSPKKKLNRPARDAAVHLTDSDTAFWLVVLLAQGDTVCLAINAKPIAPGGQA
jgi:hypothetical protein